MRILRLLLAPLTIMLRLLLRPLALLLRTRAASDGWIEVALEGEVREYPPARPTLIRRLLRARDDSPRVVLSRLDRLAREVAGDPRVRGVLVRLGPLGGGWATTMRIRRSLTRMRDSGKKVVVYVTHYTGNREYAVATGGSTILTVPPAVIAPAGSSSSTLFLGETLARAGIKVEVASAGRYKSAPDALTRTTRSEPDREQTTALIKAMDTALEEAVAEGRKVDLPTARAAIDGAPYTGGRAAASGLTDGTARDDDLPTVIKSLDQLPEIPELVDAGDYLGQRILRPIVKVPRRVVGIVQCHGAIVDRMNPYLGMTTESAAVEKVVVNDLRAALADRSVAAVVLHVDSRGGSVIASDAIYSAVKRLDAEKPVIACFGDVAASGGYYVACGARAIVASPLTVTGSIGVFGMMPTWPGLAERLSIHPDAIAFHTHATMADPWRSRTEEERAHGQAEVEALYREFITLVAAVRNKTVEEVDALAQGRVWIGSDAAARGLVDGLGGLDEAIERAQAAARKDKVVKFAEDPRVIRAKKPQSRPEPVADKAAAALAIAAVGELAGLDPAARSMIFEALALRAAEPWARAWAWAPVSPR